MYVERVPNRKSPPAILLRESHREGDKIKKRTLANLSHWSGERIERLRRVLRDWLVRHARRCFEGPLRALSQQMGVAAGALQVRCQRTRWGSCSRHGTISLNACLLFQSPQVLRYLMIHELSHRRHMNHSAQFWAEVARHEPDWRALDRELLQGWRLVPGWIFR